MPRRLQHSFAFALTILILGGPLLYARLRHHDIRNFHVVREGVLYRSGQLSAGGLRRIVRDYRIKTVITLRDAQSPGDVPPDSAEEAYCRQHGCGCGHG
jgi:hypothetical protein